MLLNMHWLRDFLPYEGTAEALGAKLTMLGLELEGIERPFESIAGLRIGRVLSCAPHPESDHLSITSVDIGEGEPLPIVCGAPNVAAGQLVPVAPVGMTMPGGLLIKAANLRGQASHGMICSERELGLSDDHSGIMILNDLLGLSLDLSLDLATVGTRFVDAFKLDMEVLDIGITPNRADCLSVLGLAREVALACKLPLILPPTNLIEHDDDTPPWSIDVPNGDLCPSYYARFINNITVKAAPFAIRARLHSVGIRPISNIVDVTNYILIELGQPLHAFDRNRLNAQSIEISPAKDKECITTLDGQERILKNTDLLVRDGNKTPIALAGVMGGANSEVTESSTHVLLESAIFCPASVRKTARRLGLSSEASTRFERGVDPCMTVYAMDRAAAMMAECAQGTVSKQVAKSVSKIWTAPTPTLRLERATSLLGMPIDEDFAKDTLHALGCVLTPSSEKAASTTSPTWTVATPSWRHDLTREIDLIEELARVQGMDTLPETLPAISRNTNHFGAKLSLPVFIRKLKLWAAGLGLNEAINYSFVGHKDLDHLDLPKDDRISIMNPLSEEQDVLRTSLAPSLLHNIRHNIAHGTTGIRLFEIASSFHADSTKDTQATEIMHIAFIMHGALYDQAWPAPTTQASYTDIRGLCEHLFTKLGLNEVQYVPCEKHPFLAPAIQVHHNGKQIGIIGRVMPSKADAMHAREAVWFAEIDVEPLHEHAAMHRMSFTVLPIFPPSRRDMTLITPTTLSIKDILQTITSSEQELLEDIVLQDVYEPADASERNVTFRLTYRHRDRTLKDKEVDKVHELIRQTLITKLGVRLQG